MDPWVCAALISVAGGLGGVVNALLTDNGFVMPKWKRNVWCPGILTNVFLGAIAAFISWALYGSGAGVELNNARASISLHFSALAGAFVVGIGAAKWLTAEVDKKLLTESIKVAGTKKLSQEECEQLVRGSPMDVLNRVEQA